MNELDYDEVHRLKELLYDKVHDLVDQELANSKPEIAEEVRQQMTEQFRFWKR